MQTQKPNHLSTCLLLAVLTISSITQADIPGKMTSKEGLEKLKLNASNAKANLEDYQKNLKIVEGNIAEITKVRLAVDTQRAEINHTVKQNALSMKNIDKQEQDVNKLIASEEKEVIAEEAKIQELEKIILLLKTNQEKRKANAAQYKEQLKQVALERGEWKSRHEQLLRQQKEVTDRLATVKKTEKDWLTKKKGYEAEISKWNKETDKQQKLHEQYTALAENRE